jgi:hypothetical protein
MPYTRETYLTEAQHALWINEVVLPSLREVMPPTALQHLPPTWALGAAKMRATHNEHRTLDVGGTNPIHYPVKEEYLAGLWERMVEKLTQPALAEFRGMFMVLQIYGTKMVWNQDNFSRLRQDFVTQLSSMVNLDHLNQSKIYVDIGKECISQQASRINWWKRCCLQHWFLSMKPSRHVAVRYHPVHGLRDVAGINVTVHQTHQMHSQGLVYAQRYSSYKEIFDARKVFPFTNKNIESLLIPGDLLQLWVRAGGSQLALNYSFILKGGRILLSPHCPMGPIHVKLSSKRENEVEKHSVTLHHCNCGGPGCTPNHIVYAGIFTQVCIRRMQKRLVYLLARSLNSHPPFSPRRHRPIP